MSDPILCIADVAKSYPSAQGPLAVLDGVSLVLEPGESLALTGESGSGKSTLLHLAAGLDDPDRGSVAVAGRPLTGLGDGERSALRRRSIGLVFQQFNLIPSLDVGANLSFQARIAGRHDAARVDALAARLGLGGVLGRYPEQLSGGQQQRVAIGRALAAAPPLILADEPTGSLDEATGDTVLALLLELVNEAGAALVLATHSARLAARLDRTAHLQGGRLR